LHQLKCFGGFLVNNCKTSFANFKESYYPQKNNLLTDLFLLNLREDQPLRLSASEVRWHYSQHFLAEKQGEAVIEDMLMFSTNKRQRTILDSQLRDEHYHTQLFNNQVKRRLSRRIEDRATHSFQSHILLQPQGL
jgi:hypothetical protein